jgi:hypothetical protein
MRTNLLLNAALERLILSWDPSQLILTREYELGFFGMIWAGGQGPVYIGWWDEREPSDQTDLKQRMRCNPWGDGRSSCEVGWQVGQTQVGRPGWHYARWAPPSVARLLISSRCFLTWCRGGICFLARYPPYLWLFSCLIPGKQWFTKTCGILSDNLLFYVDILLYSSFSCLVNGL